jgi:hypothetical protein
MRVAYVLRLDIHVAVTSKRATLAKSNFAIVPLDLELCQI